MQSFRPYVNYLEQMVAHTLEHGLLGLDDKNVSAVLDGQPTARLRDLVPLRTRKEVGAFFTGAVLAQQAVESYAPTLSGSSTVFDPACGAGDLLVACARHLPVGPDLGSTLASWGTQLRGYDLYPEFIRAAKARLILLAMIRGVSIGTTPIPTLAEAFPYLMGCDALTGLEAEVVASHVVLNPPYSKVIVPSTYEWGSGKVSQAAVFLERTVAAVTSGTRITAILPDVLRTGTLYAR